MIGAGHRPVLHLTALAVVFVASLHLQEPMTPNPLKTTQADVSSLTPYEKNSRTHSPAQIQQLCDAITEFGFNNPLLIDEDRVVLAGHGRLLAAQQLGLATVPVVQVTHLSAAQKKAYVISDNKLALNSGWNQDLLLEELTSLGDLEFNLETTGFDFRELDAMGVFAYEGEAQESIQLGTDPKKSRPTNVTTVLSFGPYKMAMAPVEFEALTACLSKYENLYGLHQGFVGWLTEGK